MTNDTPKIPLFQRPAVKNILAPLLRGALKSVPFVGTPIAEVLTNLTQSKDVPKKHTNISILVQASIGIMLVLDLILNKGANIKSLMDLIGLLPPPVC